MSTATFPFLKLPAEIRAQIYIYSFSLREAPFDYKINPGCQHNELQERLFFAFKSIEDHSQIIIRDLTFDGCSRRTRRPQVGFFALRLACRQLYLETYHFIKLPPINLRTHGVKINALTIGSLLQKLDVESLRDHVQELGIGFRPICNHNFSPLLYQNPFNILSNLWASIMRLFWKRYGVGREQCCPGDRGATIQPLVELLATFPALKTFRVDVVPVCLFRYNWNIAGDQTILEVLKGRGVEVDFQFKDV